MSKFYVYSGSMARLVQADDARSAALWALHCHIERTVPVEDLDWTAAAACEHEGLDRALESLETEIQVSQRGFTADDAHCYCTADLLIEWHQLMTALARLQQRVEQGEAGRPGEASHTGGRLAAIATG